MLWGQLVALGNLGNDRALLDDPGLVVLRVCLKFMT
ncbi:hypothetical protein ACVIYL_007679 [Bradyrhizobium sp. USDA 3315]